MRRIVKAGVAALTLIASGAAPTAPAQNPQAISIARSESLQATKGAAQFFTGSVQIQRLFPGHDPAPTSGGKVSFAPGARSAGHTHPLGQILIVTDGTG